MSQTGTITKIQTHSQFVTDEVPNNIDLGFLPVDQIVKYPIVLQNKNPIPLSFEFENSTFQISPNKGIIHAKSKLEVILSFTPTSAEVIVSTQILNVQQEPIKVIKISAIGKYPFISLNTKQLSFGSLLVGKQLTKEIIIKNSSQVPAKFEIQRLEEDEFKDFSFQLDFEQGEIPPQSSFLIKVTYAPKIPNHISVTHFQFQCKGGNNVDLESHGVATGYQAYLSTMSINFGEIRFGTTTSRLLTIHNDSDLPTKFEFFNQQGNVFSFSKTKGVIGPQSYTRIIVYFQPQHKLSYYERVFAIIRNHSLTYVDLIGTCYDLLIKPLPLVQKHVDQFRKRVIDGLLTKLDFKYLENSIIQNNRFLGSNKSNLSNINTLMENGIQTEGLTYNQEKQHQQGQVENEQLNEKVDQNQMPNQVVLHKELFLELKSENNLIQLTEEFLDFGYQAYLTSSGSRDLTLVNKLPCTMTIYWISLKEDQDEIQNFYVYPEQATLKPLSQVSFQITFRPSKNQFYFFQSIQFFAIKQNSKNTELLINDFKQKNLTLKVEEKNKFSTQSVMRTQYNVSFIADQLMPSLCYQISCVGHSFGNLSQPFIPMLKVEPNNKVYFPPCQVGHSVFQTIELINKTDTPTYFRFSPDVSKTFRVYPQFGLIKGKEFQIIIIEFCPQQLKYFSQTLNCSLNHNMSSQLHINVNGYASEPQLEIANNGQIFFPPAYLGVYSKQKIKVQNKSRIPSEINISIPQKYLDEVFIQPVSSKIKPNECLYLDCAFIPLKKKNYKIQVPIQIYDIYDPSQELIGYYLPGSGNSDISILPQRTKKIKEYNLVIHGAGGDGSLKMEPEIIDFGIVKVNFNKKIIAKLENFSNCTFYVELRLRQIEKNEKVGNINNQNKNNMTADKQKLQNIIDKSFSLDFKEGIIAANSKIDIGITFNPNEVCDLNLQLECIARERGLKGVFQKTDKNIVSQKCLIQVKGQGKYPQLRIVDVRNEAISVATLWENFQINKINKELANDLDEDEKKFLHMETLNYNEVNNLMKRLNAYEWNFGYCPIKPNQTSKPRKIIITIENVGGTLLEWNFKLPSDSQIEVEPWADPGEPTEEEAFEKAILERKIFDIYPKKDTLVPGERKDVQLIYNPGNEEDFQSYELLKNQKKENLKQKHFLQVILQILNGKPLLIHFKGNTLAPMEGLLYLRKNTYSLPDVPVGSLLPVTFPVEINNVGTSTINYKVAIREVIKGQTIEPTGSKFKHFDIQNPNGELKALEKSYLYCQFRPLEARNYEFLLFISVFDLYKQIDELIITVNGNGYYGKKPQKKQIEIQDIPRQRSLVSPYGSQVFFSIEEIDFGELQAGKTEHRLIILYNLSSENKLNFKFNLTGLICGDELELDPVSGEIAPKCFYEIKLSLTSSIVPSVYEGEIECEILWKSTSQDNAKTQTQNNSLFDKQTNHIEKETLFLRIKKRSQLQNINQSLPFEETSDNTQNKHAFEIILGKALNDIINDPFLEELIDKVDDQPIQLYSGFDDEKPVNIEKVSHKFDNLQSQKQQNNYNYQNPTHLFLNDEFTKLSDQILENTFYNIIQETTRKEADLLRVSKTFLTPNKQYL